MKARVLKGFVEEGWFYEPGMTAEFKAERAKELEKEGLIKIIKEKKAK